MKIKVFDTPEFLFEYSADVVPKKDEYIYYNDTGYKVSYITYLVEQNPDTGQPEEAYAVAEVAPTEIFFNQQLRSYKQYLNGNK